MSAWGAIFFARAVAVFEKIPIFAPGFPSARASAERAMAARRSEEGGEERMRFFEKSGKEENLSDFICTINFLYLLLQSKTVDLPM